MDVTKPFKFIGFGAMDVTKPYKFIGFGVSADTEIYTLSLHDALPISCGFIGFGAMDVTKPCEFIGFGAMDVTKPYEFICFFGGGIAHAGGLSKTYFRPGLASPGHLLVEKLR